MVFLVRESSDMSSTIVLTEVATNSKAKKVYSVRNNQLIVKSESQTSVKRNFSQVIKVRALVNRWKECESEVPSYTVHLFHALLLLTCTISNSLLPRTFSYLKDFRTPSAKTTYSTKYGILYRHCLTELMVR